MYHGCWLDTTIELDSPSEFIHFKGSTLEVLSKQKERLY